MKRVACAIAVAALGVLLPAPASGDTTFSTESTVRGVTAYGGALVWVQSPLFRPNVVTELIRRRAGRNRRIDTVENTAPFDADLGPGADGGIDLVYQQCRWLDEHGLEHTCDVVRRKLGGGEERKVPGASRPGCRETTPSTWKGTVAFVREKGKCKPGLYVRPPGGPTILLRSLTTTLDQRFERTDVKGSRVAAVIHRPTGDQLVLYGIKDGRTGRRCSVRRTTSQQHNLIGPVLSGRHLFWSHTFGQIGPPGTFGETRLERSRATCGARIWAAELGLRGAFQSIAVDDGKFYAAEGRIVKLTPTPDFKR